MPVETWLLYVTAILVMMSTPGPSQLLMLSNSSVHGFRRSLATAAGDLTANALQMLAAGLGLAALLTSYGQALYIVKWAGAAYLIWLGITMLRGAGGRGRARAERPKTSLRVLWLQGFVTSASNPKAIVFFAALFPQFIAADQPLWPQLIVMSMTYLCIDGLLLSLYGFGAESIATRLSGSARPWIDRIGGTCIIGAGVLLGLKTLRDSQ